MNKKLITLMIMFVITGSTSYMSAGAYDARIAQIDDAFTPGATKVEQTVTEQSEDSEKATKKGLKFWTAKKEDKIEADNIKKAEDSEKTEKPKFWQKNKNDKADKLQESSTEKKRSFVDAKKYAEKAYKDRNEEIEQNKKKNSKFLKRKQKPEKADAPKNESDKKTIDVKLDKKNMPDSNTEIELKTQDGKKTVVGSVSANKIISVDDCVKIALENNPSIVSQMMSRDIYKNKIAQAWSNYFPTLTAGLSYSKNDMLMTNFKFPMQKYQLWNAPNLGFNQLIFDFGKTRTTANISKKTFEAAEDSMQGNINEIIYQVKNAYYNLLYAMQQVQVYEDTVANYEIHLKQAKAYYDIGTKAKIDVTTAAYNLDNAKLSLIQARNSIDMSYAQLNNAMGVPEFVDYEIKEKLTTRKYDVIFDDAMKTAYDQRPALLAAEKKMEASQLLIKASKVAFLPDVKGFGNYTRGGKNPDSDYSYQIGAQMTYQNVNLLLLKQQIDEAKLTYLKDKADFETQKQTVYLEVKQAYIQFKNAQESIPVAKSSMLQAKEQYDLASGRYKVGMGDAVELKDAENTYRNAQLSYYNTLTQYNICAANLEKVVGAPILPSEKL